MLLNIVIAIIALILGIILLTLSSDKAIEHSVDIASALGISPLMIGLLLVSVGTDLPEIANSITASLMGHGNLNVGDSLGSVMTQITLTLGLVPFVGRVFKVHPKRCMIIGASEILALILAVSIAEKGYISRIDAFFLVASWPIFMLITRSAIDRSIDRKKEAYKKPTKKFKFRKYLRHFLIAILGFTGVAVGAYMVIQSAISLSTIFNIPEYILSFFILALGTSLPELVVELTALRRGEIEIAIGDAIGSCIVDATLSIGIGPLLSPIEVSGELVMITGLYALLVSVIVISTLSLRGKLDKKAGALFVALYLLSYLVVELKMMLTP